MSSVGGNNRQRHIDMLEDVCRGPVGGVERQPLPSYKTEQTEREATEAGLFPSMRLRELIEKKEVKVTLELMGLKLEGHGSFVQIKGIDGFLLGRDRVAFARWSGECQWYFFTSSWA